VTEEPRGITREERNASWTGSKCNVSRTKASVIHKHRDGAELCAAAGPTLAFAQINHNLLLLYEIQKLRRRFRHWNLLRHSPPISRAHQKRVVIQRELRPFERTNVRRHAHNPPACEQPGRYSQ
jgi:hypothetical protein